MKWHTPREQITARSRHRHIASETENHTFNSPKKMMASKTRKTNGKASFTRERKMATQAKTKAHIQMPEALHPPYQIETVTQEHNKDWQPRNAMPT
jgi:hypothetical protein